MEKYNPKSIEPKWQKKWAESGIYKDYSRGKKFYALDMFPYPSGDGLHVGHVEGYTASDIYSRYLRMNGKNVLHPMGWDAFGLPAENYAIKAGVHPAESTQKNIQTFKKQIKSLGLSYDWSREIDTSSPEYYKWTQWFFLFLYKNGLAYRKKAKVNWCESCKTVLANEQVEDGRCERCKKTVIQKDLEQWFFRITDFAEDLIKDLDKVDWPESTKIAQKNWIGKSEGTVIRFPIVPKAKLSENFLKLSFRNTECLEVFTTRLDTIFGCTYCVVSPEHELVASLLEIKNQKSKIKNIEEIRKYVNSAKRKTDLQRTDLAKEKTGVEIKGLKVINPFTNEAVPIFVADYVLSTYGTGAVMAVPAHDERDWEFATKYGLPIIEVIALKTQNAKLKTQNNSEKLKTVISTAFTDDGILINSGKYSGLASEKAREEMTKWLEKNKLGEKKTTYKLRDWLISRQRYWGAPIPVVYCENCAKNFSKVRPCNQGSTFPLSSAGADSNSSRSNLAAIVPVPEEDLPVLLPEVKDYRPRGTSPLGTNPDFVNTICPQCGGPARRETDTMDTFVCSSWYFFRFADPKNEKEFAAREKIQKWLPVDLYIGGAEHTVLHLLYSRFFTKSLHKHQYIDFDEPFAKLRHQGIVLAEDGRKMSKSLGNVINPDEIVKKYGADTLRLYEMFMGPIEDSKNWNTKSIIGLRRFLERVWKLREKISNFEFRISNQNQISKLKNSDIQSKFKIQNSKLESLIHKTIKKVTEDIENLRFNTAISALMILLNEFEKQNEIYSIHYTKYIILLSPFAPHIAEELWEKLGHKESIFLQKWPQYDPDLARDEEISLVIQVNGRVRDQIKVPAGVKEEEAQKLALGREKVVKYIAGKEIKKVVFVRDRLINLVTD